MSVLPESTVAAPRGEPVHVAGASSASAITSLLGIRLPLIQAPLAGVQGARLATAVSRAGGLGSLPAALLNAQTLHSELTLLRDMGLPYQVNFFAHTTPQPDDAREARWRERLAPYYAEFGIDPSQIQPGPVRQPFSAAIADLVEPFRPPVVSFHFGLPSEALLARVKGWGAVVLSSATTVQEALWLEANGADAIIAQGWEAGGHRGHFLSDDLSRQPGTLALLPQIVAAVDLPVIAAGGIINAAGIRAAMTLGAQAVQLGTAFLLCDEATTSAAHRQALREPAKHYTALTNLMTGRPARGIVNRLMREVGPLNEVAPEFPNASNALGPLRAKAEAAGSGDFSPLWAGQNFAGLREIGAAALVAELAWAFEPNDAAE
ncbi:NAD(P)H-dependent flavin oxidoreductase [Roseateles amylovorans]|uniref:Propionate 3-nitronate monooxygenase n=1 Tax=Roseateles amylovorans TaxID=2978473 RepID=A0ABY6B398_9BURK|nr:nitronate monooxygenase family protein [Roseateles amylovorans]UXH79195.1 nitronate monooxygenase family protein [Roseateles amylovorans]